MAWDIEWAIRVLDSGTQTQPVGDGLKFIDAVSRFPKLSDSGVASPERKPCQADDSIKATAIADDKFPPNDWNDAIEKAFARRRAALVKVMLKERNQRQVSSQLGRR